MKIHSITTQGVDGLLIDIECSITNGLPTVTIVGLGGKAVDEAKERIRSAFSAQNMSFPKKRIVINLAPADIPKNGASYDLAITAAILLASKQIKPLTEAPVVIGEVALDGSVNPVRGIIGKLHTAKQNNIQTAIVPAKNLAQAQLVGGINIIAVSDIREFWLHLTGEKELSVAPTKQHKNLLFPLVRTCASFGLLAPLPTSKVRPRSSKNTSLKHSNIAQDRLTFNIFDDFY